MNGQCALCRHRIERDRCAAYPLGIPDVLLEDLFDHRLPFEGDRGIRFEPRAGGEAGRAPARGSRRARPRERERALSGRA